MKTEERQSKKIREERWMIIKVALVVVLISCLIYMISHFIRERMAQKQYEEIQQESVVIPTENTESPMEIDAEIYDTVPEVDFDTLWETNTDICAWLYIPDSEVNYPILRKQDAENQYDDYYLQHTVSGQSGLPASIYIQPCNRADFTDYNVVVYGHHMKNGTMFGSLHQYLDAAYMKEHQYVYVVTPEEELIYQVFAAVEYDDRHILQSFSFTEAYGREAYLDSLRKNDGDNDYFREDVEATENDRLLTLSTCIKNESEKRLLVEAVLVNESER